MKNDTGKVNTLNRLANLLLAAHSFDSSAMIATRAEGWADKLDYLKGKARAYYIIASNYRGKGDFPKALEYYIRALQPYQQSGDKKNVAMVYTFIGITYDGMGNYEQTLNYYMQALAIDKELGDKHEISRTVGNIGAIYFEIGEYDKAMEYFNESLPICIEIKDKFGTGVNYANIGDIYHLRGNVPKAMYYYSKAIAEYNKIKAGKANGKMKYYGLGIVYGSIGNIYFEQGCRAQKSADKKGYDTLFNNALQMNMKALQTLEQNQFFVESIPIFINIGNIYIRMKNFVVARTYFDSALTASVGHNFKEQLKNTYLGLASLDSAAGNYKAETEDFKKYIIYRDSITAEANEKKIVQEEMSAEFKQKQEAEKAEISRKETLAQQEKKKQKIIRNAFIAGFALTFFLALFIYRSYSRKRKDNIIISRQKEEVERHRMKLMDSINYAKKIQYSLLPPDKELSKYFSSHFVYFQPKDIVSGDFYWFHHNDNDNISYLAVADCTGHGVPGACMSMLANSFLNEAVIERKLLDPGEILSFIHHLVFRTLQQEKGDEYSQDGMDVALIVLDHRKNIAMFSGAKNNASIFIDDRHQVLKATPKSVGGASITGEPERERYFGSESFELKKGMMLAMCTDGIVDQLNTDDEKFGKNRLAEILQSAYKDDNSNASALIERTITEWKSNLPQQDDMLVMAVRIR